MTLTGLDQIFSPQQISTDESSLKTYGRDWTKHYTPAPSAVVFPKATEEVLALVKWARQNKVALVPSGGRTGLSAAAFALKGEVVVSFEKMNRILDFNPTDQVVTCDPGVITETLQSFAWEKGYYFPVDFAARGSSHIGGNIATNAGGIKVVRYGLMRPWVSGLEVVTGSGEVLKLNRSLVKNASGYDLRQLFIGSEGTLGFITRAELMVTRQPTEPFVFVFGVPALDGVMNIFSAFRKEFPLLAYEMFTELALRYVVGAGHVQRPFATESPYYVLVEIEKTSDDVLEKAMALFESCVERGWIEDGTVSQSPQQAKNLWRLREDITESTSHKHPYKNDVSVRISEVPSFLKNVDELLKKDYPHFEVVWFGHIGDGNLHINILKPDAMSSADFVTECKRVDQLMFSMIEKHGGSISAEHGVGLTKKPFLHHTRSAAEIAIMKQIKSVFDPDQILNPGKIFD